MDADARALLAGQDQNEDDTEWYKGREGKGKREERLKMERSNYRFL